MDNPLDLLPSSLAGTSYHQLSNYLQEIKADFQIEGKNVTGHIHYVPIDLNTGKPDLEQFSAYIMRKVIAFCVPPKQQQIIITNAEDLNSASHQLTEAAYATLKSVSQGRNGGKASSGEIGELILFIMLEAVMGATCVASKPFLKMNSQDNVKGCDGIHILFTNDSVTIFYGESKISPQIDYCINKSAESVGKYHKTAGKKARDLNVIAHNIDLNIKGENKAALESEVIKFLNPIVRKQTGKQFKEVNACLLAYTDAIYEAASKQPLTERNSYLTGEMLKNFPAILAKIDKSLASLADLHFHYFVLPFSCVEELQDYCQKVISNPQFFAGKKQ